jgi:CheY-like chemotaxis protein
MTEPILIVEDRSEDAQLLEEMLRHLGVSNPIRLVSSAVEAVAYLQGDFPYSDRVRFPLPKLLLLDLKMPGMDGFELMAWLKTHRRLDELQVIVVSGVDDMAAIRRAYQAGARSFLPKPYSTVDLENLMRAHPRHWNISPPPPRTSSPDRPL